MGAKREPAGRDTSETRPWPEGCEVYWSRSWRLFAVVGKAGVSWSDFVGVVEEAIVDSRVEWFVWWLCFVVVVASS